MLDLVKIQKSSPSRSAPLTPSSSVKPESPEHGDWAVLDHMLISHWDAASCQDLEVLPDEVATSRHRLLRGFFSFKPRPKKRKTAPPKHNWKVLRHEPTRERHLESLAEAIFKKNLLPVVPDITTPTGRSLDLHIPGTQDEVLKKWEDFVGRGKTWVELNIPLQNAQPKKPWISPGTLELIDLRSAIKSGDMPWEHFAEGEEADALQVIQSFSKRIKKSARSDRKKYIANSLGHGDWNHLTTLKPFELDATHAVRDMDKKPIPTHRLPDKFAEYYETHHWTPLPDTGPNCPMPAVLHDRLSS